MRDSPNAGSRYRWYIFTIFSLEYALLYFHRVCPAVLAQEFLRSFGTNFTGLGLLASAYFYPYAIMQIPVGVLADRWGSRNTSTTFGAIAAFGSVMFALSWTINSAVVSRLLIGLGVSAVFVPAMKVFAEWFSGDEYGQASGYFMAIGNVGWLVGTTPIGLLSEAFSWRVVFIFVCLITLSLTALTWLIVKDRPDEKRPSSVAGPFPQPGKRAGLGSVLRERHFWPVAIWSFMRTGTLFGFFGLWAGPFLTDVYGLRKIDVGNILIMVPLSIIIGTPLFGFLSDRVFRSRKAVMVGSSAIHCAFWLVLLFFYHSFSMIGLYFLFFLMGMLAGAPAAVGFSMIKELFPSRVTATAIGAANFAGFLGSLAFQPFVGYLLDMARRSHLSHSVSTYSIVVQVFFAASVVAMVSTFFCEQTVQGADQQRMGATPNSCS